MITEDYVSFETAKLLKEKGFDEGCYFVVNSISKSVMPVSWPTTNSEIEDEEASLLALPTLQMAMKWLREVHNLFIFPFPQMNINKFWIEIYQLSDNQEWKNIYCESIDLQDYSTYETACEAAIKYCLENLI